MLLQTELKLCCEELWQSPGQASPKAAPHKRVQKEDAKRRGVTMRKQRCNAPAALAFFLALTGMVLCGCGNLWAQSAAKQIAVPLPPMGWSSWNSFSNTIDSQITLDQAKAMVANGMKKAGYQYINIDEGWWLGKRDEDGNIVVDPKAWPALAPGEHAGDMSNIVRAIHGLGLKAGIYTDAGTDGCSTTGPDLGPAYPNTGSEGHYEQDFLQFAKWGFDYVKVDWCGGIKKNLDPSIQYAEIARAIARAEALTGHRLYYSICNWGVNSPWTWAPNIGGSTADIWRTGGDIVAPIVANSKNSGRKASFAGVLKEFDSAIHSAAQHTGFYNDPDMMVVGMQGLTETQNRVHMGLWALAGGPLLAGADLTKLSDQALATLTNPEVIKVDQDALGLQAVKVAEAGTGLEVWSKLLSTSGERAVILLNRTSAAAPIAVRWSDLGLSGSSSATVRDLWAGKDLGRFNQSFSATVPASDTIMLVVRGSEGKLTTYKAAGHGIALTKDRSLSFTNVATEAKVTQILIAYTNPDKTPRFAELRVNGQIATRIAFPSTGSGNTAGAIWIQSLLDRPGAKNVLSFSTTGDAGPSIESVSLK
jgi:hypothetical protein